MLADLQGGARRDRRSKQSLERALALHERHRAKVVAVQIRQIEGEKDQLLRPPRGQGILQGGKARDALLVLDHDLAVDQRLLAAQTLEDLGEHAVAVGPVQARSGDQPHLAAIDARDRAIAVELDLVQPLLALGHPGRLRGQLRPELLRQRRFPGTLERRGLDRLALSRRPGRRLRLGKLLDPAAADHALGPLLQNRGIGSGPGERIALLDQQPVVAALALLGLEAHEGPATAELLAVEAELEAALAVALLRVAHRDPGAPVPHDHPPGAVLTLRDLGLEVDILERVVFDMHREPPGFGVERGAVGHRPALQRVAELQAQVVVQPPRRVLLHDEQAGSGRDLAARRLARLGEIALFSVAFERVFRPTSRQHPSPSATSDWTLDRVPI